MRSKIPTIIVVTVPRSIHGRMTDHIHRAMHSMHRIADNLYSLAKSSQTLILHHRARVTLCRGFPLVSLTHCVRWSGVALVIARIITRKSLSFRVFSPQNHRHLTPCHPPLTPIHFKKLSLFHSSLLTSVQPCVKLEYMRLKGLPTGQHSKHTFYRACARPKTPHAPKI